MGRSQFSMVPMELRLRQQGFRTLNYGYDSFGPDIETIAGDLNAVLERETEANPPAQVHFVTHSLGGIVVRQLIEDERPEHLGRVVMMAPPNQGSETADRLSKWVGWMLRPITELKTENSTVAAMPPPEAVEIAVIAGDRDGKVSLEESHLEGEAEHVVVASGHTFIMTKPSVARMTACFLRTGATAGCEAEGDQ
ncbi:hypothetical protein BSZ36_16645 [Rubricoccus marinus]|uniref:DUF7379 domain-containing protein n=2 Tax=Rubricoccus marinus TaxID=716817 RepID=A0A259U4K5_9BACT|nr:hypothetical protein BSZ36_16645 [Rubricoccus marinus]